MMIGVSGPSGAGKSTLTRGLAARGWTAIAEPVSEELESQGLGMGVFEFQKRIVTDRAALIRIHSDDPVVILDRSLEEDDFVFFRLHQRLGHLSEDDVMELRNLDCMTDTTLRCDAYICVSATPDILRPRLSRRGAPSWLIDSIDLQCELYNDWFEHVYRESAVLLDSRVVAKADMVDSAIASIEARLETLA